MAWLVEAARRAMTTVLDDFARAETEAILPSSVPGFKLEDFMTDMGSNVTVSQVKLSIHKIDIPPSWT